MPRSRATGRPLANSSPAIRRRSVRCRGAPRPLIASEGDDIAQAAFLTAWRRRSTWRGGSFSGWVCAIAYREFLAVRKGVRVETGADEDHASPHVESGERIDLTRAMAALDESERAAVALCIGAGLSHTEAALVMQAPLDR